MTQINKDHKQTNKQAGEKGTEWITNPQKKGHKQTRITSKQTNKEAEEKGN